MTTILIDATAWKKDVYDELTDKEVQALKQSIKGAIRDAGFVTGRFYLLPELKEDKTSSALTMAHPLSCSI